MTPDEQSRLFLSRIYPWNNDGAFRTIWYGWHKVPGEKPIFYGNTMRDIDQGVWLARRNTQDGRDVYVCMSVQAKDTPAKDGAKFGKAAKSAEHAVTLNSFWLDVDVKSDGYADDQAAVAGISAFIKTVKLPRPNMIIHTGGGIHFHWIMDAPMSVQEWRPLAEALKTATLEHNLPIDTMVIADAARIMRLPGTFNHKQEPRRPVRIIGTPSPDLPLTQMRTALAPFVGRGVSGAVPFQGSAAPASAMAALGAPSSLFAGQGVENIAAGITEVRSTPIDMKAVCEKCPLFNTMLERGGQGVDQGVWNLAILATTFAPDGMGLEWAHKLSKDWVGNGGETYNPMVVDAKFHLKVKERGANPNIGWPACSTFARTGRFAPPICSACDWPSKGIKTPLTLGANDFDLPQGYMREHGHIFRKVLDKDGNPDRVQVTTLGLKDAYLESTWEGQNMHVTLVPPKGVEVPVTLPGKNIPNMNEVAAIFGACGMPPGEAMKRNLKELMVSWVGHLQTLRGAVRRAHAYGWAMENGIHKGFAYNGRLFSAKGNAEPTRTPDGQIREYYTPQGDIAPWKDAASFITNQKRPALDAILAASFGAPLIHFTGQPGVVLSAQSQLSGVGKTSAMRVAAAAWGHPRSSMMQLDDTTNTAMHRVGAIRNLPVFWDEIKGSEQAAKFSAMAFQLAQGREKARMTANVQLREMGQWETMLLVASNEKIASRVSESTDTPAGVMRVLEWEVPMAPSLISTTTASQIINKTDYHFGHAGLIYAEYLGRNADAIHKAVERAMIQFETLAGTAQEERFWVAGAASMVVGAAIAKKLGLVNFDLPALQTFLLDTITLNRRGKAESVAALDDAENVWNLLMYYLNDRQGHMLVTDIFTTGGTHPAKVMPDFDHSKVVTVEVQVARDLGMIRIDHASFSEWCRRTKRTPSTIEDAFKKHFKMTTKRTTLGGGTPYTRSLQAKTIEMDVGKGRF